MKDHASEIIDKVKEDGLDYVITRDGTPVAFIVSIERFPAECRLRDSNLVWNELLQIGEQISCV